MFSQPHVPASGVWCPAVTFFDPEKDVLDLYSQKKYYAYLSKTGLAGLVILGTNAEAFLLTREERAALIAVSDQIPMVLPQTESTTGHKIS